MYCDDAEEARDLLRHKNSNVTRGVLTRTGLRVIRSRWRTIRIRVKRLPRR